MSMRSSAPQGATLSVRFEMREVRDTWTGASVTMPVVPVVFKARRGGGWWLLVAECPFCGEKHAHGSNRDADWQATNNANPLIYAPQPKYSHCTSGESGIYLLEIVAGLPREVSR